uniref:N-acetylmuramoyl-L-alanine amidase n=1 Tax=uncultured Bacillota bacterium TaxID=344338 RepID=A0A650EPB2_9FIRM|nr:hypothetical protein Firmicute1046_3480 [uncultured Firmicutes bacterium]
MSEKKQNFLVIWVLLAVFAALFALSITLWQISYIKLPDNVGTELTGEPLNEVIHRNSPYIQYAYLSPNADFPRKDKIRKITIHHMAGTMSLEKVGKNFANRDREASANYAVDINGKIGCYVEEHNRPWTSSSRENDHQAITIEVANDEKGGQWHVSDASMEALIELCADICRRNNIKEMIFTGNSDGNLTLHSMFSEKTECPGPYLTGKMPEIADRVNRKISEPVR